MDTSLRRHINWPKLIELINDPYLLLYIAIRADEDGLRRMLVAYPECVSDVPTKQLGPFPLSLLRRLCEEHCQADGSDVGSFYENAELKQLGFPVILCAHSASSFYESKEAIMMPIAVSDRYDILSATVMPKEGDPLCFPNALFRIEIDGKSYFVGWINSDGVGDGNEASRDMYLFPADLVRNDMDATVTNV